MEPAKDIVLVMPYREPQAPYFARAVKTVQAEAAARGGQCHMLYEPDLQQRLHDPAWCGQLDQPAAGIIVFSPHTFDCDSYLRLFIRQKYTCVLIRRKTQVPGVVTLMDNDTAGARLAMEHLYGLGHRAIGYFKLTGSLFGAERRQVYCQFMQQHGLPFEPYCICNQQQVVAPGHEQAWRRASMEKLWAAPAAPTAFFCYCDHDAIQLMKELTRMGRQVPRDIALVGFNDDSTAATCHPPLTTVRKQVEEMCTEACRLIFAGKVAAAPAEVMFPHTLVVRQSCGAAVK